MDYRIRSLPLVVLFLFALAAVSPTPAAAQAPGDSTDSDSCHLALPDSLFFHFDVCHPFPDTLGSWQQFVTILQPCQNVSGWMIETLPEDIWLQVSADVGSGQWIDTVTTWVSPSLIPNVDFLVASFEDTLFFSTPLIVRFDNAETTVDTVWVRLGLSCFPDPDTIVDPPDTSGGLVVTPDWYDFELKQGRSTVAGAFIRSVSGAPVWVDFATDADWIDIYYPFIEAYTPCSLQFAINTDGLQLGFYHDTIFIYEVEQGDSIPDAWLPISLTVLPDSPPALVVEPTAFSFTEPAGTVIVDTLFVGSDDTQQLPFTVHTGGSEWLHVGPVDSTASLVTPEKLVVEISPTNDMVGTFSDTIFVVEGGSDSLNSPGSGKSGRAAGDLIAVPVTVTFTHSQTVVVTEPSELQFVLEPGGSIPSVPLQVYATNGRSVPFVAVVLGGSDWLAVLDTGFLSTPTTIHVSLDAGNLPTGYYEDSIGISSPLDIWPPDFVADPVRVRMWVDSNGVGDLIITPPSIAFEGQPFQSLRDSVHITTGNGSPTQIIVGTKGSSWLTIHPSSPPGQVTPLTVQLYVWTGQLLPGLYHDTIFVIPTGAGGLPQFYSVPVTLHVTANGLQVFVEPSTAEYILDPGESVTGQAVVYEVSGASVPYTVYGAWSSWLTLDTSIPGPYYTPDTIFYEINTAGLQPGWWYGDTIRVAAQIGDSTWQYRQHTVRLHVRDTVDYIDLVIYPTQADVAVPEGGLDTLSLLVYEADDDTVLLNFYSSVPWLSTPLYIVPPQTPVVVPVTVNPGNLPPGTYVGQIGVVGFDPNLGPNPPRPADTVMMYVTLQVTAQGPVVRTDPESFDVDLAVGEVSTQQSLLVYEQSGASVPYAMTIAGSSGWIQFDPAPAVINFTPDTLRFVLDATNIPPGEYFDTLIIYNPFDSTPFPDVYVPVALTVHGAAGSDSLLLGSDTVLVTDPGCVVMPVMTKLGQPIKGATIPLEWFGPAQVCSVSTAGLITGDWQFNIINIDQDEQTVFIALINNTNSTIPVGLTTVANVYFTLDDSVAFDDSVTVVWDTTLMDNPSRALLFADTAYALINPGFIPYSGYFYFTNFPSYLPGDLNCNGLSCEVSDIVYFVEYAFYDGPPPCVLDAADVNGDCFGPDIADIVMMVDYAFIPGTPELRYGCLGSGSPTALAKHSDNFQLFSVVEDGQTVIYMESTEEVRGVELRLRGVAGNVVRTKHAGIELVEGQDGADLHLAIADLDGGTRLPAGRIELVRIDGTAELVDGLIATTDYEAVAPRLGSDLDGGILPGQYSLGQNYPNPFNPSTEISFTLAGASDVRLEVFNIVGQRVAVIADGFFDAGEHTVTWDGRGGNGQSLSSGIYLYRFQAGTFTETRKMVLMK